MIACAGRVGARLIVFPEAFIPTYPDWVWAIPSGEMQLLDELYTQILANAVTIPVVQPLHRQLRLSQCRRFLFQRWFSDGSLLFHSGSLRLAVAHKERGDER
jgi:hypothetical protein